MGTASPSARLGLVGQSRLSATPARSVASLASTASQPEHWQHHVAHSATPTPAMGASHTESSQAAAGIGWSQHPHALPRPLGQPEGAQHAMHQVDPAHPGSTSSYGYVLDSSGRPVQYQPADQVPMNYDQAQAGHPQNPYQSPDYQARTMAEVSQQNPTYAGYQGHQGYMANAPMAQSQQPHPQGSQHLMYNLPPNLKPQQ